MLSSSSSSSSRVFPPIVGCCNSFFLISVIAHIRFAGKRWNFESMQNWRDLVQPSLCVAKGATRRFNEPKRKIISRTATIKAAEQPRTIPSHQREKARIFVYVCIYIIPCTMSGLVKHRNYQIINMQPPPFSFSHIDVPYARTFSIRPGESSQ